MSRREKCVLCVCPQHLCLCVKREDLFFFSVGRGSNFICRVVLEGCGLRLAFRAKSSTNPAGRGPGLGFQREDLEEKRTFRNHIHKIIKI